MKECPHFEKSLLGMAEPVMMDAQCDSCKHKADPYCGPMAEAFFEDRTPLEDRWPDSTDPSSRDYIG